MLEYMTTIPNTNVSLSNLTNVTKADMITPFNMSAMYTANGVTLTGGGFQQRETH